MQELIKIENLSKKNPDFRNYPEKREWLLDSLSISFPKDKVSLIVGENGCGKSTLLNCISGLTNFENGSVEVISKNLNYKLENNSTLKQETLNRHKLGIIFQQKALWDNMTVLENFMLPLKKIDTKTDRSKIENDAITILEKLGVKTPSQMLKSYPNKLSGGEQRKVAAARTFLTKPDILLIDELEANLDLGALEDVLRYLKNDYLKLGQPYEESDKSLIIISHRIDLIELKFSPQIFLLSQGRLSAQATSFNELTSNTSNNKEITSFIQKVIDPAKSQWFYGTSCLRTASDISKLIIQDTKAKMSEGEMLQKIGNRLFDLVCKIEPNEGHLLMIVTLEKKEDGKEFCQIRSLEMTDQDKGLLIDGDQLKQLCTKIITVKGKPQDGNKQLGTLNDKYHETILTKICELDDDNSAIEFAIKNHDSIHYEATKFHEPILGCKKVQPKIDTSSTFIEICKMTNTIYTIVIKDDENVYGAISIDTTCDELWSNTLMEQFSLVANMSAVAINYSRIKK